MNWERQPKCRSIVLVTLVLVLLTYSNIRLDHRLFQAHDVGLHALSSGLHQALSHYCYAYTGIEALNKCCLMKDYSASHILQCAKTRISITEDSSSSRETRINGTYWVFVGDSHIRNLFDALVLRLSSPRLKYRMASYDLDDWRDMEILFATRRATYHGQTLYIKHLEIPFLLIYHWDPMLLRLSDMLSAWNHEKYEDLPYGLQAPDLLVTGACLHWMKNTTRIYNGQGAWAAVREYQNYLEVLSPLLEKFAKTTRTIFKLQDHLQMHPKNVNCNNTYIDLYNSVAKWVFASGYVSLWSSTLPLSDIYAEGCLNRSDKKDSELTGWKCIDPKHVGHVMVDQYVDMLLNDVCNSRLKLPNKFC